MKDVVDHQQHGNLEGIRKRETEGTDFGRGCQGKPRTPEVDSKSLEQSVKWVLAKPEGCWGMKGSTIREPSGRHEC